MLDGLPLDAFEIFVLGWTGLAALATAAGLALAVHEGALRPVLAVIKRWRHRRRARRRRSADPTASPLGR
jgi:hypothetical protein